MKIDISKMTRKELTDLKAKQLDEAFVQKYPNGCFSAQIWDCSGNKSKLYYGIHWAKKRRTSHTAPYGISVVQHKIPELGLGKESFSEIHLREWQSNSWGNIKRFPTLEQAVTYAKKKSFTHEIIEAFVYNYEKQMETV